MLTDKHVKVVHYEQNSIKLFPNNDITGGLAILYRDKNKDFGKIGVFTSFSELSSIANKVSSRADFESIVPIIYLQEKFNLKVLYGDHIELKAKIGSKGKERRLTTSIFDTVDIFTNEKQSEKDIKILGLIKNQRLHRFINCQYLDVHPNLYKWKVILPKSNGSGAIGEAKSTALIGSPLIGEPLTGHTQSFISIGAFDDESDAKNTLKYIKSKFARIMLGILKITQDNNPPTWAKVPMQDFTSTSDIDWSKSISEIDQQLYKKYGLNQTEIDFIETKVKPMD